VENRQGVDIASLYLVLAKPLDHTGFDFTTGGVGITLQNEMGDYDWVIFEVPAAGNLYYYPAVSLGALGDGQATAEPFLIHYSLVDPPTIARGEDVELGIPQWHLLALTAPVPEPSTALLAGLGLAGLAARRRSRS